MWYVTPISVILIISGWLISVIALYAWKKHANIGFAPFFLLLGDALWKVCFGIALGTHDLPARLFWTNCQYIGIGLQIIGTTLLAMTYAGKENWLTPRRNWLLIALIPTLSVLLAFSNDAHRLMWVQAQLLMHDNLATLDFQFGPLYWIYIFYNFLVVILTALILARAFLPLQRTTAQPGADPDDRHPAPGHLTLALPDAFQSSAAAGIGFGHLLQFHRVGDNLGAAALPTAGSPAHSPGTRGAGNAGCGDSHG